MTSALTVACVGGVLPGVLWLVAALLAVLAAVDGVAAARVRRWPSVPGVVTATEVVEVRNDRFKPRITYRYQVDGASYESTAFTRGQEHLSYSRAKAEASIAAHPPGAALQVRVAPGAPGEAVVEVRSLASYYLAGAVALAAAGCAFGGVVAVVAWASG